MAKDRFNSFGSPIPKGSWGTGYVIKNTYISKKVSCSFCDNYDDEDKSCTKTSIYPPLDGYKSWMNCPFFSLRSEYETPENLSAIKLYWKAGDFSQVDYNEFSKYNDPLFNAWEIEQRIRNTKEHKVDWFKPGKEFTKSVVDYIKKYFLFDEKYESIDVDYPKGFNIIYDFIETHLYDYKYIEKNIKFAIITCFDAIGVDVISTDFLKEIEFNALGTRTINVKNKNFFYEYSSEKVIDVCIKTVYMHMRDKQVTHHFEK